MRRVPGLRDSVLLASRSGMPLPLPLRSVPTARGIRDMRLRLAAVGKSVDGSAPVLVIAEDVTDADKIVDDPARLREHAESRFLAMVAHELRNPLGPILHALHFIRQRVSGDRMVDRVRAIAERQVQHQARLLDDLLDLSGLRAGTLELRPERLDLVAALRDAVDDARLTAQANAQELTLATVPDVLTVRADPARVAQALRNLLDNALKYTEPGGRIRVDVTTDEAMAVVKITDSGIGIDPESLARIFEPFARAETSAARTRGGLGVGLSLVRAVVERHGGTVVARSAGREHGSEFEVRLPVDTAPATSAAREPVPAARARHVLVIEDNRDAREMLRVVLELGGHHVEVAADGATGVRLAAASAPDVVLVDIGLPQMDGYEVARQIRKRLGAAVRLIALTGYGDAEARHKSREAGFDAHVVKPVAPEDLETFLTE